MLLEENCTSLTKQNARKVSAVPFSKTFAELPHSPSVSCNYAKYNAPRNFQELGNPAVKRSLRAVRRTRAETRAEAGELREDELRCGSIRSSSCVSLYNASSPRKSFERKRISGGKMEDLEETRFQEDQIFQTFLSPSAIDF